MAERTAGFITSLLAGITGIVGVSSSGALDVP
jgi:hypothetical protein